MGQIAVFLTLICFLFYFEFLYLPKKETAENDERQND